MDAYIVAGFRSAVGKAGRGGFRNLRSDDLAAHVIKHLMKQVKIPNELVDDLVVGNAMPEGEQGMQMGRYISLLALGKDISGFIVNRWCGSGLEAIAIASMKIHAGQDHCIIAGGAESMSQVPMGGYRPALNWNLAKEHADYYIGMGLTAEQIALEDKITREDADMFSFQSHQKALKAIEEKKFENEIVPIEVEEVFVKDDKRQSKKIIISIDEGPRKETSLEALAKLKPAFAVKGTVTAGNSSQTSDGAAFVMVVSESFLKEHNLKPIAKMISYATAGVEPKVMGFGPVVAVPKALKRAGLALKDIDLIELNEAFATQSLGVIRRLGIDMSKTNVNGGAVALGHPLGCSGAKLSVQLFNELKRRKQKYGMVTACVGGGQGVAGIYEML